jgi:hypothetical protein
MLEVLGREMREAEPLCELLVLALAGPDDIVGAYRV